MITTTWKDVALITYQKLVQCMAMVDFSYPVKEVDREMKFWLSDAKMRLESAEVHKFQDVEWKTTIENAISICETAMTDERDAVRIEKYYGIVNRFLDTCSSTFGEMEKL